MITILSGGTGTPKLLEGFSGWEGEGEKEKICVIVNTAEDVSVDGLYVSPDLDTVVYTLAGLVDGEKWYGQKGDTYHCHEMMASLGYTPLLRIGDRDRGVKSYRTVLLGEGVTLSEVTESICRALKVGVPVFPMCDERVTTRIVTEEGVLSFHEFWITRKANVNVRNVYFEGIEKATPVKKAVECMNRSSFVLIGPSNPITSIGPIIAVRGYREILREKKVAAISPVMGEKPFSGPAGVLMRGMGYQTNCVGVAECYRDFLDVFVIHKTDEKYRRAIEDMGIQVYVRDILFDSSEKKREIAAFVERVWE